MIIFLLLSNLQIVFVINHFAWMSQSMCYNVPQLKAMNSYCVFVLFSNQVKIYSIYFHRLKTKN